MRKVEPITKVINQKNNRREMEKEKKKNTSNNSFADILKTEEEKIIKQKSLDDIIKENTVKRPNVFVEENIEK